MKVLETGFPGLFELEPRVFEDARGYFYESYSKSFFEQIGVQDEFVQDNQSLSQRGVVRGLHFQAPPFAQGKLVRVITGAVLDIALDIRKGSPTYGKHHSVHLSAENKKLFWIPAGFAHGFCTLQDNTIFTYKCTNVYAKNSEGCILWNDESLNIDWEIDNPIISEKDKDGTAWHDFETPFVFSP
jgi:dTDP-4-dehydrorhamnose 3,5-epimerase